MELAAIRKALHVERNVDKANGPPRAVSVRSGQTGSGYADVGFHHFPRALCHLMRRLAGYGGADVKRFLLDTKKPVLDLAHIRDHATLIHVRRAGNVRQELPEKPARARFRRRERPPFIRQFREHLARQILSLHSTGSPPSPCSLVRLLPARPHRASLPRLRRAPAPALSSGAWG